ncbi:MAG: SDR family NAD(P)-dependent oxidoreductase, partial [Candidatus Acidiferrales bacterium]
IKRVYCGESEALGEIAWPAEMRDEAAKYQMHPALLDACLQVAGAMIETREMQSKKNAAKRSFFLPVAIEKYELFRGAENAFRSHARIREISSPDSGTITTDVTVHDESGAKVAGVVGLRFQRVDREAFERASRKPLTDSVYEIVWKEHRLLSAETEQKDTGAWLVFDDGQGIAEHLAKDLRVKGGTCTLVAPSNEYRNRDDLRIEIDATAPDDYARLLADITRNDPVGPRGVVLLWPLRLPSLEKSGDASVSAQQEFGLRATLYLVQALGRMTSRSVPKLWIVTRGSQAVRENDAMQLAQAPVWGLGKTIALEHPELACHMVDLGTTAEPSAEARILLAEILGGSTEDQIALRDSVRHVARLARHRARESKSAPENKSVRLETTDRGTLESLMLQPAQRRAPGPGEVEIRVHASGLNFRDVLSALDLYPGEPGPLGSECAGEIVSVGSAVKDMKPGDAVVAIAPGSFANFVTTRSEFVAPKPTQLSFEEAATVPVAFLTAYFTLKHLAAIQRGHRVLIHAGAGGVGMAAVQLAQQAGAEIFATAGSPEKREILKKLGVQHVLDSRTPAFAAEILSQTGGKGVDIVLNSLSGEMLGKSFECLARGGTFLEIGKRGIWNAEQATRLDRGIRYFIVDWSVTAQEDPALIGAMLRRLMSEIEARKLTPLPRTVFPLGHAAEAFRFMAQARHTGKIVFNHAPKPGSTDRHKPFSIRADATYLITGGLGGLGLLTAKLLADQGARHLLLAGRSSPSAEAAQAIQEMEMGGARVVVVQEDISTARGVRNVVARVAQGMPPLKGIIHCAAVLDDGALANQDWPRFIKVLGPKADGAWHLHTQTRDTTLDFFALFSSIASVFGSRGQGNYTAANSFLDALAQYRRSLGLPALSIDWGAWTDVGIGARGHVEERLSAQGMGAFSPKEGLQVLNALLHGAASHVVVMPVDWPKFLRQFEEGALPPLLQEIAGQTRAEPARASAQKTNELLGELAAAAPGRRSQLLFSRVEKQAAKVLGLDSRHPVDADRPLHELGLDSLMAVELRNSLGASLGHRLPATVLFDYPTLRSLTDYLGCEVLGWGRDSVKGSKNGESAAASGDLVGKIEQLSDEDVERLFRE